MNAFYEHHQDSIRFGYRCFDRILLNGLIQPFQQPKRVIGFFATYRRLYPVSRDVLRGAAEQLQCWVKDRADNWNAPIVEAPKGQRVSQMWEARTSRRHIAATSAKIPFLFIRRVVRAMPTIPFWQQRRTIRSTKIKLPEMLSPLF
jgi:hypothetical protein